MIRPFTIAVAMLAIPVEAAFGQMGLPDDTCALRGAVTDEQGTPLPGVRVDAFTKATGEGRRPGMSHAGSGTTTSAGQYCLHSSLLHAPPYLVTQEARVFIVAQQWFSSLKSGPGQRSFPSTWYPGTTDFRSAKLVTLGSDSRADFNLASMPTYSLEGSVVGYPKGRINVYSWSESPDGLSIHNGSVEVDEGRFKITNAGVGDWTYFSQIYVDGDYRRAKLRVSIGKDLTGLVLAFEPLANIKANVNGKPWIPEYDVFPQPADYFPLGLYRVNKSAGSAERMGGTEPGVYKLINPEPIGSTSSFKCIESFIPGDVTLNGNRLIVERREYKQPMSIEVGRHCAVLEVKLGYRPLASGFVLLEPESVPLAPVHADVRAGIGATIRYPWPLTPGKYTVYAFDTIVGLEYENPAVMKRYRGATVTLEADKTGTVTLDTLNQVSP